ncbi:MAG: hypothetical protein Q9204_002535, partial [Flavoplaca sp. TL-2023a]
DSGGLEPWSFMLPIYTHRLDKYDHLIRDLQRLEYIDEATTIQLHSSQSRLTLDTAHFETGLRYFRNSVFDNANLTAKFAHRSNLDRILDQAESILAHATSLKDLYVVIQVACITSDTSTREKIRPPGISVEKTLQVWQSLSSPWGWILSTFWPQNRERFSEFHKHLDRIQSDLPALEMAMAEVSRLIGHVQDFITCLEAILRPPQDLPE